MSYTRRNIIKGLSLGAGYSVLSPILGQLKLNAAGIESRLPKRFVFLLYSLTIQSHPGYQAEKTKKIGVSLWTGRIRLERKRYRAHGDTSSAWTAAKRSLQRDRIS